MSVLRKIYSSLVDHRWLLGFIEEPLEDVINHKPYEIHYVTGIPRDRWYADPFILDYNDKQIILLVEEWRYINHKGRIAKLIIDRNNYQLLDEIILLELDTHLSFPFIIRKDGKVYVAPENSASGKWNLYEYDSVSEKLKPEKTIVSEPLTDAISTDLLGKTLIFSTRLSEACGSVLSVYSSEGIKLQDIDFHTRVARGAGDWFEIGSKIYRPAQDCNGGYGKAVIIQEINNKSNGSYEFRDVLRIESTNLHFNRGCHTFNHYRELSVVDVYGYRRKWLGPFVDGVKDFCKKLYKG